MQRKNNHCALSLNDPPKRKEKTKKVSRPPENQRAALDGMTYLGGHEVPRGREAKIEPDRLGAGTIRRNDHREPPSGRDKPVRSFEIPTPEESNKAKETTKRWEIRNAPMEIRGDASILRSIGAINSL